MAHSLILGITGSGKTTLATRISHKYKNKGIGVLVLDPFKSARWGADFITDNPDEYLNIVFSNKKCALFIDESGDTIGRYSGAMSKLATISRHYGHNAHFIAQRAKQIDCNVRSQCQNIFLFKQSLSDTKDLSNEFVSTKLMSAHSLRKGEYLMKIGVDGDVIKSKVF